MGSYLIKEKKKTWASYVVSPSLKCFIYKIKIIIKVLLQLLLQGLKEIMYVKCLMQGLVCIKVTI